jgi:hypothetical protein
MASWIRLSIEITRRGLEISLYDSDGAMQPPATRFEPVSGTARRERRVLDVLLKRRATAGGIWVPERWPATAAPIFVEPPARYAHLDWELIARALARHYWRQSVPVARYVPPAEGIRNPFQLPLRLVTLGQTRQAILGFERHRWVQEAIRLKGLAIQHVPAYAGLRHTLSGADIDAIVCDDYRLPNVLDTIRAVSLSARPELIVSWPTRGVVLGALDVPSGTSLYQLPSVAHGRLTRAVDIGLQGLVTADPTVELPTRTGVGGIVYCGPDTMGASRFPQAGEQVEREAAYLEALARAMELVDPASIDFERVLGKVREAREVLTPEVEQAAALILPMSETIADLRASASALGAKVPRTLTRDARERLVAEQQRRVDVALRRVSSAGVAEYIARQARLEPKTEYRLCVKIGQAFPESLLEAPPPPIDPLLPKRAARHRLTVVLFPKDLRTRGPRVRPLALPEFGPSREVSFGIVTPASFDALEARIAIYYGNQLLQNYRFVADADGTRATLEFSQTAQFKNLDKLGKRALSLSMNEDADGSTHSIMLYRDGVAKRFRIPAPIMKTATDGFWDFLKQATGPDKTKPRFSTYPEEGEPIAPEFHEVLKQAIDLGNELYRGLKKDVRQLTEELAVLRGNSDVPVQITRLHRNYVFPWTVFYDWLIPEEADGDVKVCTGWLEDGKPCAHNANSRVYCANGCWGIRHVLEEQIGGAATNADAGLELIMPKRPGAVLLSADQDQKDLDTLMELLPDVLAPLLPAENLLERVWDADSHPAIAIIYGHTETEVKNGRRIPKRITLPGRKFLSTLSIDQKTESDGELNEPRPVILLLACDTALIDVGTLNDFVSSFHYARAPVIIGTESVAFRSLLARFAREMTVALADGRPLGKSLREFRRGMIRAGNPIPFVFHAVGTAEFHIKWEED